MTSLDYHYWLGAGVAQLVEQLICNQPVGGSTPFTSSNSFKSSGSISWSLVSIQTTKRLLLS